MKTIIQNKKRANGFKDITGKRFGRILVLSHAGSEVVSTTPKIKYKSVWNTICDCGNEKIIRGADLGAKTISCGCYSRERTAEFNKKTRTKESYNAFSSVWMSYRRGAKDRGYSFNMSKDEFLNMCKKNCFYCGRIPDGKRKSRGKGLVPEFLYNGIDRVNNSVGYEPFNIVPCCKYCNRMKRDMTVSEFISNIEAIHRKIPELKLSINNNTAWEK